MIRSFYPDTNQALKKKVNAIAVCAEAAVMYYVFGELERLGLCRQRNSASYSTER